MKAITIPFLLVLLFASPVLADDPVTIPVIYVEHTVATEGPVSLFNVPDGTGTPFTAAFGPGGSTVDATITMTLYDDYPGWGQPVAHFPYEDMWLESDGGLLVPCVGGTCADANTDLNGVTTWSSPLNVGGRSDPDEGASIYLVINGAVPDGDPLVADLRMNSPDLNGDLQVNLADVAPFAQDFYGLYAYRSDFVWDGMVNLSDLAALAQALGANCP